jgi:glycosyltransferase involved in cell wall biosynthesis
MNRLISENLDSVTPASLPPRQREGPARILFLSIQKLGLKSNAREMERATADRDDVDAVHIRLEDRGWRQLLTKRFPGPFGDWWGLSLPVVRYSLLWNWRITQWLRGPLSLDHFDAVHVITRNQALAVVRHLAKVDPAKRKLLAIAIDGTCAADGREFPKSGPGWWLDMQFHHKRELRTFIHADLLICRSKWCRDSAVKDYGFPVENTQVVYPSPSLPKQIRQPREFGPDQPPIRIGFVGNTFQRKGGDRLVRWFAERWQGRATLHLVSRDAVLPNGVAGIEWQPQVPREALINEFYPSLDLFVLPTRADQITWVLCEAANAGVACIGPRMAGIPEAILHKRTGLIVDDHTNDQAFIDAVESLLNEPELLNTYGAAAAQYAKATLSREANYPPLIDKLVALVNERNPLP